MNDKQGFGDRVRVFAPDSNACGSIVKIGAGNKTEMTFHLNNDKIIYILGGRVKLIIIDQGVFKHQTLEHGASVSLKAGVVHQLEALEEAVAVEFGTYVGAYDKDGNDNRIVEKGTTLEEEVEVIDVADTSVVMTDDDRAKLEEAVAQAESDMAEEVAKPAKKKRRRRKKKKEDN